MGQAFPKRFRLLGGPGMPRARRGEWGIRFEIVKHRGGYAWVEVPDSATGRRREVLAPVGMWIEEGSDRLVLSGQISAIETRSDRKGAWLAYRAFRVLANNVIAATAWDAMERHGDGRVIYLNGNQPVDLASAAIRNRRAINEYANRFGLLQRDLMTLGDWEKELLSFDDTLVIANAVRSRQDVKAFADRVHEDEGGIFYSGRSLHREAIARKGDRLDIEGDGSHDLYERMIQGNDQDRARQLLARLITRRLKGGVSFGVATMNLERAAITPANLLSLLYLRMWLHAINWDDARPVTHCQNPACRKPLQGRRDKRFCDALCRTAWHNARRHRSHAGTDSHVTAKRGELADTVGTG